MKLSQVSIRNFKVVRELNVDFSTFDGLRRLTLLLGDNGSGKTSALQAIALVLSLATRQTRDASQLAWNGFMADRLATLGTPVVELQVQFDQDETDAVAELFDIWRGSRHTDWLQTHRVTEPGRHPVVTVRYEGGRLTSPQGAEGLCQFLGRYYVKVLSAELPQRFYDRFTRLGDVFWFDQYRYLGTARAESGSTNWVAGLEQLRDSLKEWWAPPGPG
ncbi:MAG: AAA family ATPase [Armatimonadetes bacterium]|nr:AAA family ATPase [Armatimonadota bacterium]